MHYYVYSSRYINNLPANGCAVELEETILTSCSATLISPRPSAEKNVISLELPKLLGTPKERVLIFVALVTDFAYLLNGFTDWRRDFGTAFLYIIDPWLHWSKWPQGVIRDLDAYFVPDRRVAAHYRSHHGVPAHPIPLGVDVLRFGNNHTDRPLEVVAYGRQYEHYLEVFKKAFNDPCSPGFLYHDTLAGQKTKNFHENRRLIWKLLHKSRVSLAFDVLYTPNERTGENSQSFIQLRYYEAAAAGCAIVGRHPTTPEMAEQFTWPDALLELPESPDQALIFLQKLLQDQKRLNAIHVRNHAKAWQYHDWRYRLRDMLNHLNLPLPDRLQEELAMLQGLPVSCEKVRWT